MQILTLLILTSTDLISTSWLSSLLCSQKRVGTEDCCSKSVVWNFFSDIKIILPENL